MDKNAPGIMQTGDSWIEAYLELSVVLDGILNGTINGTQVWVANGTYKPAFFPTWDPSVGTDTRYWTFQIIDGLEVYGGFRGYDPNNGGEQALAGRAGLYERTILSGDLDGDPANILGDAYSVVSSGAFGGSVTDVRLDGFMVEYGNASGGGLGDDVYGGGLRAVSVVDLVVANCTFRLNVAKEGGGAYVFGGNVQIKHCTFKNNAAKLQGGGAKIHNVNSTTLQPSGIFNTIFRENFTFLTNSDDVPNTSHGGGLYVDHPASDLHLCNLLIYDNQAARGAGAYVDTRFGGPKTIWTNCTVAYNKVTAVGFPGMGTDPSGGGFYVRSGSTTHVFRNMSSAT